MCDKSSQDGCSPSKGSYKRVARATDDEELHAQSGGMEASDMSSPVHSNNSKRLATSKPTPAGSGDNGESCPVTSLKKTGSVISPRSLSVGTAGNIPNSESGLTKLAVAASDSEEKNLGAGDSEISSLDKDSSPASYVKLSSSDGVEFSVKAALLSSKSGYFNSCLRSGMKESLTKTVQFANLTSSVLGMTLTFIKTSVCSVSLSCIRELLFAAAYLQIPDLQDYCCAFLTEEINIDTYATIYGIAESFSLTDVLLSLKSFLCTTMTKFSETKYFKELSVNQLIEVLGSDNLNVVSEKEVLDMVVLWLWNNKEAVDPSSDIPGKLLGTVRIPCLYTNSHSEISTGLNSVVKDNVQVADFLSRLKYYQDHPELCHKLITESNSNVRKGVEVIMTLGGLEQGIWKKQPSNKTKFVLTSALPDSSDTDLDCPMEPFVLYDKHTSRLLTKVYEHCTCTLDNFIYLLGGQTAEHDRAQFATSAVYRFDPRVFEWTELCPMSTCRSLFYVGCVKGKLYAIGGASRVGVENTVECYVPSANQWTYMKPMLTKLHEHAGCVHEDNIYISGGHDGMNGTCSNLWCFQPDKDSWSEKTQMSNARANHTMVTLDGNLLVFGGCQCTDNTVEDIWECESYDISMDQWTVVTSLPRLSSCLASITVGKLVLCFGGYTFSFCKYVDMVQVYNTENNSWKTFKLHMNAPKCLLCEKIVVNEVLLYAE